MTTMLLDVSTPQGHTLVPETFQVHLTTNLTTKLQHANNPPPCLLRAPTGSGKTYVLCRVLANVSADRPVIWFWFVPFVNLINQTLDALITNAGDLSPVLFNDGINQEPRVGQVLISTTQGVSRAAWRKVNYNAGGGELARTPAEFVALARATELEIGVVVDEAHIALDKATEFGQFVQWLRPRYLTMATATPKSDRINQFLASASMGSYESFNVSRDDVVRARLNKAFVQAVIYQLKETTATVADLKRTVIKQAWLRNQALKAALKGAGIDLTPLLLVQVENGKTSIEEAERDLIELCKVPPQAIGKHSSDTPDPDLMDAIANDTTKEVLIFKQSAGTGFDAPRAFVLASTKAVNDPDFALQFIGRVMRVSRQIRATYTSYDAIPDDFNTAYIYLANAEAQQGFQQAIQTTDAIQSQLEGQVEKMARRVTQSGATVITNRSTNQPMLDSRFGFPEDGNSRTVGTGGGENQDAESRGAESGSAGRSTELTNQGGLFGLDELDELAPTSTSSKPRPEAATSKIEWDAALKEHGITPYPLRRNLQNLPTCLKREARPDSLNMADIVRRVATRLVIQDRHLRDALLAVRGRLQEIERHTELTKRAVTDNKVTIVIDRNRIAAEARAAMGRLPQIEEADQRILIEVLASRVTPRLQEALDDAGTGVADDEFKRMARTAACWLIRVHVPEIEEGLYAEIANQAVTEDAAPLPDAMLFATSIALPTSTKNLYGILPPSVDDLAALDKDMMAEDRMLMQDKAWQFQGALGTFTTARFDYTFSLNTDERRFAEALDRAPFVAWWFRNPDKKPYSVRIVRGEHRNFFYPDFVVCLSHVDGSDPLPRLIETKHDLKDARRKAKHVPDHYGKVLFLTNDGGRFFIVTDEGGIGEPLDLGDLEALRETLQRSAP
ncbi:MAG: DEAD/DEAH box helicase family protein [Candidimonas sp.]|nr:DEAD/DEAH box helicase family protein [Candidimonas sp.]